MRKQTVEVVVGGFGEEAQRQLTAAVLTAVGDGVLKKIRETMGGEARRSRQSGRTGGTVARTRRGGTDGDGRRGRQTEYMAKQRKVFLEYLKVRPETASVSRITRARECWAIHRKEWDVAAKKGIGYADYKGLARSNLI